MADALNNASGDINTGPGAEGALKVKQVLANLGIIDPNDPTMTGAEIIKKQGAYLASAAAKDLAQRPTQFDFKTFLQNNPGLDVSVAGNKLLINIMQQQAQHKADLSQMAYSYKGDPGDWNSVVANYDKTHPIISPYTGKPLDPSAQLFPASGDQTQQNQNTQQEQTPASGMPTATAPDGRRVKWNGNAWVPVRSKQ